MERIFRNLRIPATNYQQITNLMTQFFSQVISLNLHTHKASYSKVPFSREFATGNSLEMRTFTLLECILERMKFVTKVFSPWSFNHSENIFKNISRAGMHACRVKMKRYAKISRDLRRSIEIY